MSLTVSSQYGPFPDRDIFQHYSAKYLELPDIAQASRVCKLWEHLFSDQNIWKALSEKEGIPLVASANGAARNYREDLKILYPITISGKIISQFFGKVVEKIPPITEERFNELKEPDPYETNALKGKTFVFIVDPSFVMRTIDQGTPLALDSLGNLKFEKNLPEKSELKIPLSLKNIKVLSCYPLKGKENMPVFSRNSGATVFKQCNSCPDKISVYFMRRHVIDQSREKYYAEQEKLVKDKGFEVTPLRVRVLFNAVSILKDGRCPDVGIRPRTFSRHPEIVRVGTYDFRSEVAGFPPSRKMYISFAYDSLAGVVPGGPAEAPTTVDSTSTLT